MAWTILSSHCFSAVRDGYYAELRRSRRVSNSTAGSARDGDDVPSAAEFDRGSASREDLTLTSDILQSR